MRSLSYGFQGSPQYPLRIVTKRVPFPFEDGVIVVQHATSLCIIWGIARKTPRGGYVELTRKDWLDKNGAVESSEPAPQGEVCHDIKSWFCPIPGKKQ